MSIEQEGRLVVVALGKSSWSVAVAGTRHN